MINLNFNELPPPVIVGATGGSGTRIFGWMLQQLNGYIGHELNHAFDSLSLTRFLTDNIVEAFSNMSSGFKSFDKPMSDEFEHALGKHLASYSGQNLWGWKNPVSMFFLPFFHSSFKNMKFIHVVRDGRNMAISKNQNQYKKIYGPNGVEENISVGMAKLWSEANCLVNDYGTQFMQESYLILRYEDLCLEPDRCSAELMNFLGIQSDSMNLSNRVDKSLSAVKYDALENNELRQITEAAIVGLNRFGYL